MRLFRIVSLALCSVALLACVGGAIAVAYFAPPRGYYQISGLVMLRGAESQATLSHRSLACADDATDPPLTTCRATEDGRELLLTFQPETRPRWGFQSCAVSYAGQVASCRDGNLTVNGRPVAMVEGGALGLADADLQRLRRAHPIESFNEADWDRLMLLPAFLIALGIALAAANIPATPWHGRVGIAAASGLIAFIPAYVIVALWVLSLGYID